MEEGEEDYSIFERIEKHNEEQKMMEFPESDNPNPNPNHLP